MQWLVKLHPALFWKLRADGVAAEAAELTMIRERVGTLPDHVQLLLPDAEVDNADLFGIVDAGVTIRGTVGLELPAARRAGGDRGTSDYAGRGFTVDAGSIEEYERNIRGIPDLQPLDSEQVELAKRYAYGVFCVRPWLFTSFALDYLPPEQGRDLLHLCATRCGRSENCARRATSTRSRGGARVGRRRLHVRRRRRRRPDPSPPLASRR